MWNKITEYSCTSCHTVKSIDSFYKNTRSSTGRMKYCKICYDLKVKSNPNRKIVQSRYQRSEKSKIAQKNRALKYRYGLTLNDFNTLSALQDHKCKICSKAQSSLKSKLCVDHCHISGRVRGLLCGDCNKALGLLRDNSELCLAAFNYLNQNAEGQICK